MKSYSLFSIFTFLVILLLIIAIPNPSFSQIRAFSYPSNSNDEVARVSQDSGEISTNPSLTPVISDEGYSHTTHVEVNQNTGTIRGYAGYNLDTARSITRTKNLISTIAGSEDEPALVANVGGFIDYETNVKGPVVDGASFATIFIEVEGSFNYEFGAPSLGLYGGVAIGITRGGNPFNTETFCFDGQFSNLDEQTWIPDPNIVSTGDYLQVFDALGGVLLNPTILGVTTDIQYIGMNPEDLKMRASLTVPIQEGDVWYLGGLAGGCASHAFLENFSEIEVGETGDVDAAIGYVDFLGTASLGIELPEGFSLEGENAPPLGIISFSNQVPLPGAIWLLGSGLLGLVGIRKRK